MVNKKKAPNPHNKFGEFLKQTRQAAGVSTQLEAITELAKIGCHISFASMCRYEAGTSDPSPQQLKAFAEVYHIAYAALVLELVMDKYALRSDRHILFLAEVINMRNASERLEILLKGINAAAGKHK